MMEKFTTHVGSGAPLRHSNVDTDQIIPAEFLKQITRTGFAEGLFRSWRSDPEFVLNQVHHQDATVLVAGPDFGTGSSREHAAWALQEHGFKVIVSSRFADIFRSNAGKNGLLAAVIDQEDIELLWELIEENPTVQIEVDLHEQEIRAGEHVVAFEIDADVRWRLIEGLDDISITMEHADQITSYESGRPNFMPGTV